MPRPRIDPSRENAKRAISRIIRVTVENIPLKLIDTCLGVIVDRGTMLSNFQKLDEYKLIEESFSDNGTKRLQDLLKSYFEYAMFSHRWNETEMTKEPTYEFIKDAEDHGLNIYDCSGKGPDGKEREENMIKLRGFCYTAAKCGFRWAWSDTCCIDKTIPSEVQVSINSMFRWYHNSALTIVYLHDVEDVDPLNRLGPLPSDSVYDFVDKHHIASQKAPILQYVEEKHSGEFVDTQVDGTALEILLKRHFPQFDGELNVTSEWCVRCWTLQEMVASRHLRFYCKSWTALEPDFDPPNTERFSDHRNERLWQDALSRSTGVDREGLLNFTPGMTNVREKLHWASRREATYVEDMAYSLLGIFDIHMPVLYGEGMKAFGRLQEEIMKRSHDLSIFDFSGHASSVNSCLAHSPLCYLEKPFQWNKKKTHVEAGAESKVEGDEEGGDEGDEEGGDEGDDENDDKASDEVREGVDEYNRIRAGSRSGGVAIVNKSALIQILHGTTSVLGAATPALFDCFKKLLESDPPLGHSLINGAITVSIFEHKVKPEGINGHPLRYTAKANGLTGTVFTTLEPLKLDGGGPEYYLVRVYDRRVRRAIRVLASRVKFWLKDNIGGLNISDLNVDALKDLKLFNRASREGSDATKVQAVADSNKSQQHQPHKAHDKLDAHEKEEREHAREFLTGPFVVFLVAKDGDAWCRVATESRIIVRYTTYKFSQAVERRNLV
ncbi:hypothetical protein K503DRAFT_802566 [Rhizopogon vinicolor AM-OR11-026]|uniref:Heterokaryon incompatibility domain-containing protein n=1 Tax=Rhizopogon vinicolor AM-OR11-026 TaxID=1314800 RepID=A0A1B7MT12_9AGAM|nr:hypothetical protein K503DRAFT_802566 [Rhizopogon vinicolor AM-OR11-026]